jgi:hypothetical protein
MEAVGGAGWPPITIQGVAMVIVSATPCFEAVTSFDGITASESI